MRFKPRSTVHNPRALVYKRFNGLEKSLNMGVIYYTKTDAQEDKYWTFDAETLKFSEIEQSLIPQTSVITTITAFQTILTYQRKYFRFTGVLWEQIENPEQNLTFLSATFNNISKYQTNKYYYAGSFDYMIKGSIAGVTTQYMKGNITPLTSLNIKHFNDDINISVDDLIVIEGRLFSVENIDTTKKMQPKAFNVYFATLNSIL